jgi:hypothetical protein
MLPSVNFTAVVVLLTAFSGLAYPQDHPWYFTADEMEIAYKYQVNFGQRLQRSLNPVDCFYKKDEVVASYQGRQLLVPCRFINETLRHLKELLQSGAAKHLFALDVDHADLAIPSELWERKYKRMPMNEILPALLREPSLVAVYRAAVHLSLVNPKSGTVDQVAKARKEKGHVLAFYDGRPAKILPAQLESLEYTEPAGYRSCASVFFLAHHLGESVFTVGENVVVFDLSFDNVAAGSPVKLHRQLPGSITKITPP